MYNRFTQTPFMSAAAREAFDAGALVQAMLDFELALVAVRERHGLIPDGSHGAIANALTGHEFDLADIEAGVQRGGNAAIPLVAQAKATLPDTLRDRFHVGATSQDLIDSALMLCAHARQPERLNRGQRLLSVLQQLMTTHARTPMIGRTLMQQALPITFGVTVAHWRDNLDQALERLAAVRFPLQFGGPVGALTGLDDGARLMDDVAARLGLDAPRMPWHTNRQPIHQLITALDAVAIALEKIATDIALLAQSEISELREPAAEGMGGSSSMGHKRNPVRCALIRTAARQIHGHTATVINAGAQPLERGLGDWHAEWTPLIEAQLLLEGALDQLIPLLEGLEVNTTQMEENLQASGQQSPDERALARFRALIMQSDAALSRSSHDAGS
ncbi:3-carboxy-cis,cis-muconate cycloisomerase [Kushneria sinocarnis]|uniref:3-carboxy-cis,cis-muconate cycloisomerase n=1 Tax=Kushneria sinocarnis TaxID=595502 RepID=A0A420WWB8_9GAMM|nr:lyase family protein [Kushneria sinocarnis]RKR03416.1 3-carboxy-cis,cis-muconate cycloisomerase [Kushneria sinocarnis]